MLAIAWPALADAERALAWSAWRRRHQAAARRCHYRAREPKKPKKPKKPKAQKKQK